jgi:hypothetical protein
MAPLREQLRAALPALALGLAGMGVGVAAVRVLGPWIDRVVPDGGDWVVAVVALPATLAAAFLAILVHEAGHALAGVRAGMRFVFLTAGPLWLERDPGHQEDPGHGRGPGHQEGPGHGRGPRGLRLRPNRIAFAWGGLTLCVPTDGRVDERAFGRYFLGGPLASLALAVLAGAAAVASAALVGPSWAGAAALLLAVMSAAILVATACIPSAGSDGTRWRRLRRGEPDARGEAALLVLSGLSMAGTRARDWPAGLVEELGRITRPAVLPGVELILAERELDEGRPAEAAERLERLVEGWEELSALMRGPAALELAAARLLAGRDAEAVREWYERAEGPLVELHRRRWLEAGLAAAEGDPGRARTLLAEARAALDQARFPPTAMQRDQLDALERRLDEARVSGTQPSPHAVDERRAEAR